MKHPFLTLILATLCAVTGYGQTIKTLGYNATNGQIVAATNVVWTNSFSFSTNTAAAQVRTNLSLGLPALTNTNVTNFRTAIGLGATNAATFADITLTESGEDDVSVENASGSIVLRQTTNVLVEFGTGESHLFSNAISFNNATNAATTRTNLGLPLPALTNTSNVTMMRALAGSTNTNQPFSGTFNSYDPVSEEYYTVTVSNGIIVSIPGL
jgi:hypothetical protein